ncbi:flagellin lysine-N-methylase [Rhodoferax sp.]|uniref:flagellin lysine-N-methylase n=1 Tax=Rhodoferax sp. TaxID=50421 RepID=UPI00271D8C19|nr:flagellin lysine-N-methylase [Rhodoferax sp.]MDO9195558.1 flagellin lysine-N-methylase [Rhodoferax sp.]
MDNISVPAYYSKFACIGPRCEDTCCSGWTISIDSATYDKYTKNTHQKLAPLFRLAVSKNLFPSSDSTYGQMKMKANGSCHFQEEDKLCAIQKNLGAKALSTTCKVYPRYLNQFGSQRENALGISCPEAARLVLLNPEPMQFGMVALDPGVDDQTFRSYRFPLQNDGDPSQIAVLNDFRAVIIATLQLRTMSVGARMMVLGCLLEDANRIVTADTFVNASELSSTLASFAGMLSNPAALEAQFVQIQPNVARKLETITEMISSSLMVGASARFNECLLAAAEGLDADPVNEAGTPGVLARYLQSYTAFYAPFFKDRQHIFENYLVNQVIARLFPFTRGTYLDLYRELVFNLSITQVLLVGMAAKYEGLDETRVIQLFQSFSRKSDHNRSHLDTLVKALGSGAQDSFVDVMWLLKDVHP